MNVLPKQKMTFRTNLTKDEIRERIARASGYDVAVDNNNFEMVRIISSRNSFLPQIKGQLYDLDDSTKIHVAMRLHPGVMVFMAIWLLLVSVFCIYIIADFSIENFEKFQLIPFGMFIFGILLMTIPFNLECSRSKKDLLNILDAEIVI